MWSDVVLVQLEPPAHPTVTRILRSLTALSVLPPEAGCYARFEHRPVTSEQEAKKVLARNSVRQEAPPRCVSARITPAPYQTLSRRAAQGAHDIYRSLTLSFLPSLGSESLGAAPAALDDLRQSLR